MSLALLLQVMLSLVRRVIFPLHHALSAELLWVYCILYLVSIFARHGCYHYNSSCLFLSAAAAHGYSCDSVIRWTYLRPFRSLACLHRTLFRSLLAIYKWCRYLERMVAAISSFLFFSVPAPHVFGFFTQLWWIQVGWSVDKRNWPISVRTTMNTSKNTKNMERLKNTERFKEYRMLLRIQPSLASLCIGYHGYRI